MQNEVQISWTDIYECWRHLPSLLCFHFRNSLDMPEVLQSFFSSPLRPLSSCIVVRCGELYCLTWIFILRAGIQKRTGARNTCQLLHSTTSLFISQTWKEVMMLHHWHKSCSWLYQGRKQGIEDYGVACHFFSLCILGNEGEKEGGAVTDRKNDFIHLWINHIYMLHQISECLFNCLVWHYFCILCENPCESKIYYSICFVFFYYYYYLSSIVNKYPETYSFKFRWSMNDIN